MKLIVDTTLRQTKKKRPTPAGASAGQELYTAQMVAKDGAENTLFTVERNLGNEIYRKAVEIADSDKRDV